MMIVDETICYGFQQYLMMMMMTIILIMTMMILFDTEAYILCYNSFLSCEHKLL